MDNIKNVALDTTQDGAHEAADAFWKTWEENHGKHGYYESTWMAINAAIKKVGVTPFNWDCDCV